MANQHLEISTQDQRHEGQKRAWFECTLRSDGDAPDLEFQIVDSPDFLNCSEQEILDKVKTHDDQAWDQIQSAFNNGDIVTLNGVALVSVGFKP